MACGRRFLAQSAYSTASQPGEEPFAGYCSWRLSPSWDLLDERLDGSIKRLHFRTNASTQFTGRQVDVQTGGFCAFVTGNERNIFEADACSFEDGTALVTEGVRGQRGKTHPFSDAFDDLVKGSHSQWTTWITR